MTNDTTNITNKNEGEIKMTNVEMKLIAAFAAAGVTADEFIAAAAAEKEALRIRRAHEETARAIKVARETAAIRREARKQAGIEKEERRKARRDARRAAMAKKAELVKVAAFAYKAAAAAKNERSVDVGTVNALHIAKKGEKALFTIPGTKYKAVACRSEGFKAVKSADIVITDEGVLDWYKAVEKYGTLQYNDRDYCYDHVVKGEVVHFTLKDGKPKTVVLATSVAMLTNVCSMKLPFRIDLGGDIFKVETQEDVNWVFNHCVFVDEMTGADEDGYEILIGAHVSLKEGVEMPQREEPIVAFTLEDLKAVLKQHNAERFANRYDVINVDEETPLDGEVKFCSECGFYSEPYGDGTEWDDDLHDFTQLLGGDYNVVVTDGDHFYGVHTTVCEHCKREKIKAALGVMAAADKALMLHMLLGAMEEQGHTICPSCGKVRAYGAIPVPTVTKPVQKLYRLNGFAIESFVVAAEECERCKTVRYGSGLDGVKDDITVNHGLWAFRKGENNVHGAIKRFREFLQLSKTAEFCATEDTQFVGDFGITIEHPQITAAFGYDSSDAWSERDNEDNNIRFATRNFHCGVRTKEQFEKEIERNLQYGRDGSQYVELIVSMGDKAQIKTMWIKADFFVGHPHFSRALCEAAESAGLETVVVDGNDGWIAPIEAVKPLVHTDGFDAVVSNYKIGDNGSCNDSWSLGHTDDYRKVVRSYLFNLLVDKVVADGIARDRKAIILCGLPGSGKSTIARQYKGDYAIVDPDVVKWLLPEYNGGNASFVHKESAKIASWVNQYLAVRGFNVVVPMIGDNDSLRRVKHVYEETGYEVEIRFVDTDPVTCYWRIQGRNRSIDISMEALKESYDKIVANVNDLKNPC